VAAAHLLQAMQQRLNLDTALVDDVVLGCVTPVGEQGADIARTAVLDADWAQTVAGVTQSRFCASGLESVNLAAAKVLSGWEDLVVAGGVESMSRWAMGSDGGAWVMDPRVNQKTGFVPQGVGADLIATLEGWDRGDVDAFATALAPACGRRARRGPLRPRRGAGARHCRPDAAGARRDHPPRGQRRGHGRARSQLRA
jgi:acetyl-CoA C-acetyltransferase